MSTIDQATRRNLTLSIDIAWQALGKLEDHEIDCANLRVIDLMHTIRDAMAPIKLKINEINAIIGGIEKFDTDNINISRDFIMSAFRSDLLDKQLTPDDRMEIFAGIATGSSDFTAEMINQVLSDYEVSHITAIEINSEEPTDADPTKEKSLAIIREHMAMHKLTVVTEYSSYTDDQLLCDPIIWVDDDLDDRCTIEQWKNLDRAGKTLHERSTEEGHEIMSIILSDLED